MSFFVNKAKWATYDVGDYSFLHQHFYHEKIFKYDVRVWSSNAKIQLEETISKSTVKQLTSQGEIKVQIPFAGSNRSLFTKLTTDGKINLCFDNGVIEFNNGLKLNLYLAYQSNRTFTDDTWKVGAALSRDNFSYAVRLRYGIVDNKVLVDTKGAHQGIWGTNIWRVNFYNLFFPDIRKTIKNGILFGLSTQNGRRDQFYLRLESGKRKQEGIDFQHLANRIIFNWTRRLNSDTKIAFQITASTAAGFVWEGLTVGGEWLFPDFGTTVKAKISSNLTHAVSITNRLGKHGTYGLGVQVSDVGRHNNFTFGSQINLNL